MKKKEEFGYYVFTYSSLRHYKPIYKAICECVPRDYIIVVENDEEAREYQRKNPDKSVMIETREEMNRIEARILEKKAKEAQAEEKLRIELEKILHKYQLNEGIEKASILMRLKHTTDGQSLANLSLDSLKILDKFTCKLTYINIQDYLTKPSPKEEKGEEKRLTLRQMLGGD